LRNNRPFLYQQLKWIAIYIAIALAISFVVPFPFSLIAVIGAVILLSFVRKQCLGKMGLSGSSMSGSQGGFNKYYCMNCGAQHNDLACPKCGSKMKRVGS
jgi:hypothetical protein